MSVAKTFPSYSKTHKNIFELLSIVPKNPFSGHPELRKTYAQNQNDDTIRSMFGQA